MIDSLNSGTANEFIVEIHTSWQAAGAANTATVRKTINFSDSHPNYIRDQLNTNPQKLLASTNFGTTNEKYFWVKPLSRLSETKQVVLPLLVSMV